LRCDTSAAGCLCSSQSTKRRTRTPFSS
jgi:hypothetical protein